MSSSFLDALRCQNRGKVPIWLMRQAGRYLPEYRELRSQYEFISMCHRPDLIAKVTLMPIERFDMDAAILFSDILIILELLGRNVRFEEGKGPIIDRPLQGAEDLHLTIKSAEHLSFVAEGIERIKEGCNKPLIGFCGGPFTVASYLIEGGSSRELTKTKKWMFQDRESFLRLLQIITDINIDYLKLQIKAGVDAVQIFDSWAHVLSSHHFALFCKPYLEKIVQALSSTGIPIILFCRGSSFFAKSLAEAHPQAISFDWMAPLACHRSSLGSHIALQGNLDPHVLFGTKELIEQEALSLLEQMRGDPGFIFGLGHGVLPKTPIESVQILLDRVRSFV